MVDDAKKMIKLMGLPIIEVILLKRLQVKLKPNVHTSQKIIMTYMPQLLKIWTL